MEVYQRGGASYQPLPHRKFIVVQISVPATGVGTTTLHAPENLVIDHVMGRSSDASGLDGFRLGWRSENNLRFEHLPHQPAQEVVNPIASTVITDATTSPPPRLGLVVRKDHKLIFEAEDVAGVGAPYVVELTLHVRPLQQATR